MKPAIAILLFSASFAHAATISGSATCQLTTQAPDPSPAILNDSGSAGCAINASGARVSASTAWSFSHSGPSITAIIAADAHGPNGEYFINDPEIPGALWSLGRASSSLDITHEFGTFGDPRPGIARWSITDFFFVSTFTQSQSQFSIDSDFLTVSCFPVGSIPNSRCLVNDSPPQFTLLELSGDAPVTLGVDMLLTLSASTWSFDRDFGGVPSNAHVGLSVQFLELDGSPAVVHTPEPGTWLMGGLALVLIAASRRLKVS